MLLYLQDIHENENIRVYADKLELFLTKTVCNYEDKINSLLQKVFEQVIFFSFVPFLNVQLTWEKYKEVAVMKISQYTVVQ